MRIYTCITRGSAFNCRYKYCAHGVYAFDCECELHIDHILTFNIFFISIFMRSIWIITIVAHAEISSFRRIQGLKVLVYLSFYRPTLTQHSWACLTFGCTSISGHITFRYLSFWRCSLSFGGLAFSTLSRITSCRPNIITISDHYLSCLIIDSIVVVIESLSDVIAFWAP